MTAAIIAALNAAAPANRRVSDAPPPDDAQMFVADICEGDVERIARAIGEVVTYEYPNGCVFYPLALPVGVPGAETLTGDRLVARCAPLTRADGEVIATQLAVLVSGAEDGA